MTWVVMPLADRAKVAELAAAIDILLGYPRDDPAEHFGAGRHVQRTSIHTESYSMMLLNVVQSVVALPSDGIAQVLIGQATNVVDAGGIIVNTTVRFDDPGWVSYADLPYVHADWNELLARDGLAGLPLR